MSADIFAKIQENRGPLGIHAKDPWIFYISET